MKAKTYKITSLIKCPLFLLLCVLCALCVSTPAQDWKTVKDGIEYAEVTREISGLKVDMNLLRLDLTKVRLDVVHAMDAAIGTEKTSSIATRHGAFAAINAGFFRLDTSIFAGDAVGILKIDGTLLSESNNRRIALLIKNFKFATRVAVAPLDINVDLFCLRDWRNWRTREACPGHGSRIAGINRERKENEAVVYTPEFNRTTLTNNDGLELLIAKNVVIKINDGTGNSVIPPDGIVVSAAGTYREKLKDIKVGDFVFHGLPVIDTYAHSPRPNGSSNEKTMYYEDIVGGVPQLIKNSKIDITWEQEKTTKSFVETRHPRTAVAMLKDGKFLMITVDGRSEASGGIGLYDLAAYLLELGATNAMNLDGGGSTTMFLDGKVVNHPSDKEGERKVSDAILVTLRKHPATKKK